jgi:hypothetical protein
MKSATQVKKHAVVSQDRSGCRTRRVFVSHQRGCRSLDGELGFCARAACMGSISVTRELNSIVVLELECLLESLADLLEGLLSLLGCPALASFALMRTAD